MNRYLLLPVFFTLSIPAIAQWDLGIGAATYQPPIKELEQEYDVIPLIAYYGERWNFQINTLGYKVAQWGDLGLSAQLAGRFDGYDPEDSPYLKGMSTRRSTLDYGIAIDWHGLELAVSSDALGEHDGNIVSLSYGGGFEFGKWSLMPRISITSQSYDRINYYYGVSQEEVAYLEIDNEIFYRSAYAVDSRVVIPEASLLAIYNLNSSWFLLGGASAEFYPDEITDSPLVDEKMAVGMFFGIVRHF